MLPSEPAERAALALCDLPRFAAIYQAARLITPGAGLRTQLELLL